MKFSKLKPYVWQMVKSIITEILGVKGSTLPFSSFEDAVTEYQKRVSWVSKNHPH